MGKDTSESTMPMKDWLNNVVRMRVDSVDKVDELVLTSRNLSVLPRTINQMTGLTALDLRYNRFESLPEELFELKRLKRLLLSNIPLRVVPASIGLLEGLTELDLSGLELDSVPPEMGALKQLQKLELARNKLTTVPQCLSYFRGLTKLGLDQNKISAVSMDVFRGKTALSQLFLSFNQLEELPDELFREMEALETLELHCNRLKSLPSSIGACRSLTSLNVSENDLAALPESITSLSLLRTALLRHNLLESLPRSFRSMESLTILNADHNSLKELPTLINCPITELKVKGNSITVLGDDFGVGGNNATIDLSNNRIETVRSFAHFTSVKDLNLSFNEIKQLPSLDGLKICQRLVVAANELAELPTEGWAALAELGELDLRQNRLISLPPQIGDIPALKKLNFSNNKLEAVPPELFKLNKLGLLNLGMNQLRALPPGLTALKQCRELYLGGNQFMELPTDVTKCDFCTTLYLGWNRLSSLAGIGALSKLSFLHLTGNPLGKLPDELKNCKSLKTLHAGACDLTEAPGFLSSLKVLETLDLSGNSIPSLPSSIGSLNFLERLDVSGMPKCKVPDSLKKREKELHVHRDAAVVVGDDYQVAYADLKGRRRTMEDAVCIRSGFCGLVDGAYWAVFDGHGGDEAAKQAAERHAPLLEGKLRPLVASGKVGADPEAVARVFTEAFKECNEEMDGASVGRAGCTAVVVVRVGEWLISSNVGDARAVGYPMSGGKVRRLSLDHKPDLPAEERRVRAIGGMVSADGRIQAMLAVSRALGDAEMKPYVSDEPFVKVYPLSHKGESVSQIVIACDGVWDVIKDEHAIKLTKSRAVATHPLRAAMLVRDMSYLCGSTDNISVLVVYFREKGTPFEAFPGPGAAAAGASAGSKGDAGKGDKKKNKGGGIFGRK